jgi:hypothetical protein
MACYINIENRYRCASLRERQMHHVWAATAAAVVSVGATAVSAGMQASAASKAGKAQAAAQKKATRQEKKALKGFTKGQQQIEADLGQIQMPVMDIGADIKDAERITGYNIAQLEQIYPGAKNQRQLASLAITDMLQGKLPQSVIGETMREAAQRGGAGFNIATAGKGAIAQAPQYDYARAIGGRATEFMIEGLNQSARWQLAADQFIQKVLPVSQNRLSYQMGAADVGLKKAGIRSDLLAAQYGAQLGQTERGLARQQEQTATSLAREQQFAQTLGEMGQTVSSAGSAFSSAYDKYKTAKLGSTPQFSSLAAAQQAAPYTGAFSQIQGMGYVPRATAV